MRVIYKMKIFNLIIVVLTTLGIFTLNVEATCMDFYLLETYSGETALKYEKGEEKIANSIKNLTNTINTEINRIELGNLNEFKNLNSLKEAESLTKLKNNFYRKQHNEIQGVVNAIKAE